MNNIPKNIPVPRLRSPDDDFRKFLLTHAPALAQLLDALDAGVQPDFLTIMAALSESVEYFTTRDNDQASQEPCGCSCC